MNFWTTLQVALIFQAAQLQYQSRLCHNLSSPMSLDVSLSLLTLTIYDFAGMWSRSCSSQLTSTSRKQVTCSATWDASTAAYTAFTSGLRCLCSYGSQMDGSSPFGVGAPSFAGQRCFSQPACFSHRRSTVLLLCRPKLPKLSGLLNGEMVIRALRSRCR